MAIFTVPVGDSLLEFNPCHEPAGSSGGGQFCAATGRPIDPQGYTHFLHGGGGRASALFPDVDNALQVAGIRRGHYHTGGGPKSDRSPHDTGYVIDYRRDFNAKTPTFNTYVTHAGSGAKAMLPKYAEALIRAGFNVRIGPLDPRRKSKNVVWVSAGRRVTGAD